MTPSPKKRPAPAPAAPREAAKLKAPKGSAKSLAGIRPSGRIQATRHEAGPHGR